MSAAFDRVARHDVALWLGGKGWAGWTEISIDRGLDTVTGQFTLTLVDKEKTGSTAIEIEEGAACSVTLAGQALVTGFVDRVSRGISAEGHTITVSGRDRAADLVDCSAVNVPGSWSNKKLEAIAREIAQPFGVSIEVTGDTGKPFARFALQQGETAWAAIERMASYRGVIAWSMGDGTIRIGNPDSGEITGQLIEGVNVVSGEAEDDLSARFSTYTVKGQASGSDDRHGRAVAQVKAEASDAGVKRFRPLIVVAEEQADTASLRKRAAWEAQTRAARGKSLTVTTPGWFAGGNEGGPIWKPGARAACSIPTCKREGTFLVERTRIVRDAENGTITELTLVPPEAWAQLAEPEPKQ